MLNNFGVYWPIGLKFAGDEDIMFIFMYFETASLNINTLLNKLLIFEGGGRGI